MLAQVSQDLAVFGMQKIHAAAAEGAVLLAHGDEPPGPVEQRRGGAGLCLGVNRSEAVDRVHDGRQVEARGVCRGEAAVAIAGPLHGRAHAVAVAEEDVVPHAQLVAVVQDRRARHGHEQANEQLDLAPVVVHERSEPPADPDVAAHTRILGVEAVHGVPLPVGDHLQGQLVMVAQEDGPLAAVGQLRGLLHDAGEGLAVLHGHRHEDARHERKVERHVALVAVAEVVDHVLGPLVGLGQ